jgi:hypothetical protein
MTAEALRTRRALFVVEPYFNQSRPLELSAPESCRLIPRWMSNGLGWPLPSAPPGIERGKYLVAWVRA